MDGGGDKCMQSFGEKRKKETTRKSYP